MFCCHCGGPLEQNFIFCPSCGKKKSATGSEAGTSSGSSSSNSQPPVVARKKNPTVLNFSSFKKEKEAERRSHFEPKSKKKKKAVGEKNEEVLINVGLMEFDSRSLRKVFGKTFPVKLFKEMKYEEVLERSLKKWEDYDRTFSRERAYVLVYPDGKLARTIPGTDAEFTLITYKEGLGKPYSRITLFLASVLPKMRDSSITDFLNSEEEHDNVDGESIGEVGEDIVQLFEDNVDMQFAGDFDLTNTDVNTEDSVNLVPFEVTDFL